MRQYLPSLARVAGVGVGLVVLGAALGLLGGPATGRAAVGIAVLGALLVLFGGSGYVAISVFQRVE